MQKIILLAFLSVCLVAIVNGVGLTTEAKKQAEDAGLDADDVLSAASGIYKNGVHVRTYYVGNQEIKLKFWLNGGNITSVERI